MKIQVQEADFDQAAEYQELLNNNTQDGAIVTFVGKVRQQNQGNQVSALVLEHYPEMTAKALQNIVEKAKQRWPIGEVNVIHRVGRLTIGEQIVFVGVTSMHREAAFAAVSFIMDYLKNRAPFWKKESTSEGDVWVKQELKDKRALTRWE